MLKFDGQTHLDKTRQLPPTSRRLWPNNSHADTLVGIHKFGSVWPFIFSPSPVRTVFYIFYLGWISSSPWYESSDGIESSWLDSNWDSGVPEIVLSLKKIFESWVREKLGQNTARSIIYRTDNSTRDQWTTVDPNPDHIWSLKSQSMDPCRTFAKFLS